MYSRGDKVRVDGVNTLRTIIDIIEVKGKNLYVCDDSLWYDENLLYPASIMLETKIILGQECSLSDFGNRDEVLNELSDYVSKDITDDEFKTVLNFFRTAEIELIT